MARLPCVCSRCGLLCTHLGCWFNSRSGPKKTCGAVEQFAASRLTYFGGGPSQWPARTSVRLPPPNVLARFSAPVTCSIPGKPSSLISRNVPVAGREQLACLMEPAQVHLLKGNPQACRQSNVGVCGIFRREGLLPELRLCGVAMRPQFLLKASQALFVVGNGCVQRFRQRSRCGKCPKDELE